MLLKGRGVLLNGNRCWVLLLVVNNVLKQCERTRRNACTRWRA